MPMALACAARSETMRRSSRSSASISARRRLSSSSSSRLRSFAMVPPEVAVGAPRVLLVVLFFGFDHAFQARELLAFAEVDQRDALGRATHLADRLDSRAD